MGVTLEQQDLSRITRVLLGDTVSYNVNLKVSLRFTGKLLGISSFTIDLSRKSMVHKGNHWFR